MDQVDRPLAAHAAAGAAVAAAPPRIYYVHPLLAGPLDAWPLLIDRIAALGFSHVLTGPIFAASDLFLARDLDLPHPALGWKGDASSALRHIADLCDARGLSLLLDVQLEMFAAGVAPVGPDLVSSTDGGRVLDPRAYAGPAEAVRLRLDQPALMDWWGERLAKWRAAGVAGFRFVSLVSVPAETLRNLIAAAGPGTTTLASVFGLDGAARTALEGCGLDFVFSSLPWWDYEADWLWTELADLRRFARVIAAPELPFEARRAAAVADPAERHAALARALAVAATYADGWLMPMGYEFGATRAMDARRDTPADFDQAGGVDLTAEILAANAIVPPPGTTSLLSGPGSGLVAFVRSAGDPRVAKTGLLTIVNTDLDVSRPISIESLLAVAGGALAADAVPPAMLPPGALATIAVHAVPPVRAARPPMAESARVAAASNRRIGIEHVSPVVEDGRFPAKRIAGERVTIAADIICDGHDHLSACVLWRPADETAWREARMTLVGNDRWQTSFTLPRVGRHEFTVEAWYDRFETYQDELRKKHAAGIDVHLELIEGRALVEAAARRAGPGSLADLSAALSGAGPLDQIARLLSAEATALMHAADDRPFAVRPDRVFAIEADRREAGFASWYEIFPRSMSDDEGRHGTFADVIRHLPRIRDMGFDVLYFPPIHPIGRKNRKGRNNTLTPAEDDPGSPYAIGSADGGHDAIHPELGTFDDFRQLRDAAMAEGLELALDFAIQCSPDHPWLQTHKGWFDWRPDGSIRYAENPPKKYEDIVNVDFYKPDAIPSLWVALAETVMFWADEGVRIFRVDNPHTKPFPFWEWLISEVRAKHPDTLFLAEAFTRPKIMSRLGKVGFNQSYTYFTWRNTRRELEQYLTELTTTDAVDFFRPNFFVNTPDINPVFLQTSGRAGHLIRAVLAATLSGLWGVYSGFELCEATPMPGREEYLNSEKYQMRAWDWNRPGNIVAEITALNHIRRLNPALQTHLGVTFLPSDNEQVMFYEKATPDRSNVVLVAVSFDPLNPQTSNVEVPLWKWRRDDGAPLNVDDLARGTRAVWTGKWQRITLDAQTPYAIWRARPAN